MLNRVFVAACAAGLVAAAPAPQVLSETPTTLNSQIPAIHTQAPTGTEAGAAPPRLSPTPTGVTSHGPFSGTPTVVGALQAPATLGQAIVPKPNPTATYYNANGLLQSPVPIPFQPGGGQGVNGTLPVYSVQSDFDFESIALALYQEWIELDLFNNGLATFSADDFLEAGLTAEDRALIAFMATQESSHATLLTNMLGEAAPVQCTYNYPFTTVREFIDFNARLTRFGESGVYGFLAHLDSREVSTLLTESIATEARQEMNFRQMLGLHPQPFAFVPGTPQSWAWTFLAPYISECPVNQTRLIWQNFPSLQIVNAPNPNRVSANDTQPWETVGNATYANPSNSTLPEDESCVNVNVTGYSCGPAISRNRTEPLTFPGRLTNLTWQNPGIPIGPNNSYVTSTSAGAPKFVGWLSQLNFTYTELVVTGPNEGYTYQPANEVYQGNGAVNETVFLALTDSDLFVTPFNLSLVNPHIVALGLMHAG